MATATTHPATQAASSPAVRRALEAGEGILRWQPTWVPRSFLMPGGGSNSLRKTSTRSALTGAASRALVRFDDRGRQRRGAAGRGTQLRRPGRKAGVHLKDGIALEGAKIVGKPIWGPLRPLARLQQVLRQPRADPAPHAPK